MQLDYDSGEVSFYDSKYLTHIYTYKDITFKERMYPYCMVGPSSNATNPDIKICQSVVSLTMLSQQGVCFCVSVCLCYRDLQVHAGVASSREPPRDLL